MYLSYWGLAESPFRANARCPLLSSGLAQEEVACPAAFLVEEQRTLGLLMGASGSGKSMLLEMFAGQLRRARTQTALLLNVAGIDLHEFLWLAIGQMGVEVSPHASQFTLSRTVGRSLARQSLPTNLDVLLMDDADEAHEDVLDRSGAAGADQRRPKRADDDRPGGPTGRDRPPRLHDCSIWPSCASTSNGWEADETDLHQSFTGPCRPLDAGLRRGVLVRGCTSFRAACPTAGQATGGSGPAGRCADKTSARSTPK